MMDHMQPAFAFDIHMRRGVDEKLPAAGIRVVSHDISEGVVFDEGVDPEAIRNRADHPDRAAVEAIISHHTTPEQAGDVFSRVKPRLAVFSHAPNSERMISLTRKTYAGPLQGAEDLLTIVIGEKVAVRHFSR